MSDSCDENWRHASFSFYRYVPALAAAVIFCILFFASTTIHLFQMVKTKTWYLTPLVVGCLCMYTIPKLSWFHKSVARGMQTWLLIHDGAYSRIHRLRRSSVVGVAKRGLLDINALSHSEHVYIACSCPIRCFYLHDSRPHHSLG
jgi:hypothetical protein